MTRWRTRCRGLRSDRGAAAVEFAIVFVVLIFIIFSIIDFGRLLFVKQGVESASREGARTAAVQASSADVYTAIQNAAAGAESLAGGGGLTPPPTYSLDGAAAVDVDPAGAGSPCNGTDLPITITVTVPFTWFTPTMPLLGSIVGPADIPSVSAETVMRCEN